MVAQSPDAPSPAANYAQGWRALAHLLSEDGSFSGHENNRFYLNLGDGTFADASAVAGLDSDRDGRAFVSLDFDRDGDLDLILKNRNSPQLMVLRNDTQNSNHAVAFRLIGRESNRDAVGAAVTVTTARGDRRQFVHLGSGFLSQSSRRLYFGLGAEDEVLQVTVTWPSGRRQHFDRLPGDRLITLREGEPHWTAQTFRSPSDRLPASVERAAEPQGRRTARVAENWLLDAVPASALRGKDLQGNQFSLERWRGRPVLVNFWATWCAPCRRELGQWRAAYESLRAAGAGVVAVSVDEPGKEEAVRRFVSQHQLPFPVLLPEPASVHAYNILHRNLLARRRDLQVPTTFLLDARGRVVKLYRGVTSPRQLLADLENLPATQEMQWRAALPYPGRPMSPHPPRDYIALASAFLEAGAAQEARPYFARAAALLEALTQAHPANKKFQLNLGLAYLQTGEDQKAVSAFGRAIALDPASAQAHFSLALAHSRLNQLQQARAALEKTIGLDPSFTDAYYNLAIVHSRLNQPQQAVEVLKHLLQLTPQDADVHDKLGLAYNAAGALDDALASFERAVELRPHNPEMVRHLGMTYFKKGLFYLAAETLEKARRLDPDDADTYVILAGAYLRRGKFEQARAVLRQLLEVHPREPRALQLLQEIETVSGSGPP